MAAPAKNSDLHGNAPDRSPVALLLMDVITDFEFEQGEQLFECAQPIGPQLKALKQQARRAGIPVVYVNDNFGRWQSDFRKLVENCTRSDSLGRDWVKQLLPDDDDYFVLKPKHSGFYGTTLNLLLRYLEAERLILAGLTGDMCVMFTASDAYLRDFKLNIPQDCVVSCREEDNAFALAYMERVLQADIRPSASLDWAALRKRESGERV